MIRRRWHWRSWSTVLLTRPGIGRNLGMYSILGTAHWAGIMVSYNCTAIVSSIPLCCSVIPAPSVHLTVHFLALYCLYIRWADLILCLSVYAQCFLVCYIQCAVRVSLCSVVFRVFVVFWISVQYSVSLCFVCQLCSMCLVCSACSYYLYGNR